MDCSASTREQMKIARAKSAISRAVADNRIPMAARASRRPLEIFAAIFVAAGFIYSFHLGTDALGASEAYSAWAAGKPGIGAIIRTPVLHDPGKQVFYYVVLHYYTRIFGLSEISLRSLSVVFSLTSLVLVFALGCEMFDDNTALAASAMWAFNPLAVVFAHTARMYPMLIAIALAQLLTLWRVRNRPSARLRIAMRRDGAALLYTHMRRRSVCRGRSGDAAARLLARGRRDRDGVAGDGDRAHVVRPLPADARATKSRPDHGSLAGLDGAAIRLFTCDQGSGGIGSGCGSVVAGIRRSRRLAMGNRFGLLCCGSDAAACLAGRVSVFIRCSTCVTFRRNAATSLLIAARWAPGTSNGAICWRQASPWRASSSCRLIGQSHNRGEISPRT